jgi:hypothetical protein
MADSFVIVNPQNNTIVVSNNDPNDETVISQSITVSTSSNIQIVSANTNPGISFIAGNLPPNTTSDLGSAGEIRFDVNYLYLCVSNNLWKKIALQDL